MAATVTGIFLGGPAAIAGTTPAPPTTAPGAPPPAKAYLLVDLDTGKALVENNDHTPLPPASLTKVLTAMIADDWLTPGEQIPVSDRTANVSPDKLGMKTGQSWPFDIVMHALLISSANDAAYALAEKVSGSIEAFGTTMQQAAAQIGMQDHPVFHDPAGLDGTEGVGGGNLVSAWDLAVASRDLMANPYLAGIVGMTKDRFTGPDGIVYEIYSHNRAFLYSYPGAVGVKTGYTDPAGVCVDAEAVRNGRHMLAVVMNGEFPDKTAEMLLDEGFATPVASEPPGAATLPPLAEPEPPAPPPPAGTPADSPMALHKIATVTGSRDPRRSRLQPVYDAAVAFLSVGAVVFALRIRRRRRAIGAHARRPEGP